MLLQGLQSVRLDASRGSGTGNTRLAQLFTGPHSSMLSNLVRRHGVTQVTKQKQASAGSAGSASQQTQALLLGSAAPAGAGPFHADGYDLPPECAKHSVLFTTIFNELRPWMVRGISREDLDACATVAPEGHNITAG